MPEDVDAGGLDAGVAELTSDHFSADQSTGQESPQPTAAAEPTANAPQVEAKPSAPAPTAAETPKAPDAPQVFNIGGRQYQAQDLERALIMAGQYAGLQEKHVKLLEQQRAREERANQPQPQGPSAAEMQVRFQPVVKQAVDQGFISKDFADAFPAESASFMFTHSLIMDARQAVSAVIERVNATERDAMVRSTLYGIDQAIANLTTRGEHFAQLADPQARRNFYGYLESLNLQIPQAQDPETLERLWIAYNKDNYLKTAADAAKAAAAQQKQRQQQRVNATGVTANSPRPTGGNGQVPTGQFWDADLLSDLGFGPPR